MKRAIAVVFILAPALLGLAAGCGGGGPGAGAENPMENIVLNDVGEAYRFHSLQKNKPPGKLADLVAFEQAGPNGVAAVKSGEIVVLWGATLTDLSEEPGKVKSDQVLAYPKQAPEQGGSVLLLDRTVKKMTAEEFKAAPKAGKK